MNELPNDLPTNMLVLKYVCPLLLEQNLAKKRVSIIAAYAVKNVWNNNGLETQDVYRIARKIVALIDEYNLHRYKETSVSVRIIQRRQTFFESLDTNFDVAKDATKAHKVVADVPVGVPIPLPIPDVHNVVANIPDVVPIPLPIADAQQNGNGYNFRRKRNAVVEIDEIDSDEGENQVPNFNNNDVDDELLFNFGRIYPSGKVCTMLDRAGISNKLASYAYLTILMEAGIDERRIVCSESTMFRRRARVRLQEATRIKESFVARDFSTIHFDGKTYFERGNVLDKRLAIVLSKPNESKVLAIKKVEDGRAETLALEIYNALLKWNVEKVDVVCFDTEAVNSGRLNRVSVRLERLYLQDLLKFACRRHVYEVFLGSAFSVSVERGLKTEGPTIPIFEKFAAEYFSPGFDRANYATIHEDAHFMSLFNNDELNEIKDFCRYILPTFKNSRNEYTELAKLVVIMLSPKDQCEFKLQTPGAYTRGRFMNRMIYCIKIYLYRNQSRIGIEDLTNIRDFLYFSIKIYLKFWFQTSFVCMAPQNDLLFIKKTLAEKNKIPNIVDAVSRKLENHLWYLNGVNVALAFFDDNVKANTKQAMARNLKRPVLSHPQENPLRLTLEPGTIGKMKNISLPELTSIKTNKFFEILGIDTSFLEINPKYWQNNEQFRSAQKIVQNLICVNDAAERAISLYQRYKDNLCTEGGKANLIQVVEENRKMFSKLRRGDIVNVLQPNLDEEADDVNE